MKKRAKRLGSLILTQIAKLLGVSSAIPGLVLMV